jgi:hypothetical protein
MNERQKILKEVGDCGFRQGWIDASITNTVDWSIASMIFFVLSVLGSLSAMSSNWAAQYVGFFWLWLAL